MTTVDTIWAAIAVGVLAYEVYIVSSPRLGATISDRVVGWLHTSTKTAKAAFAAAWFAGTLLLVFHILTG
ncbi:hypothetical protein GCM10010331_45590 [Streptomyces xanthochromogenes]|uniref:hypothetical protein n=1 Tax=Streptomyces xanthochromogenes TaxID=67384 RepID=UPI00167C04E6|nr:hypothetical protein [Streptomyces xanthochromogenes]GHB52827.1 hypothetical protein GCM10010331_45590 [Streptomyces xanthochromogenes]